MAYHHSNLGDFAPGAQFRDQHGYIPTEADGPWALQVEHHQPTHDEDGTLTEYGEWWEEIGYPDWQLAAIDATREAEKALRRWQRKQNKEART